MTLGKSGRGALVVAALSGLLLATAPAAARADNPVEPLAVNADIPTAACDEDGTTGTDATLAAQLNTTLTDKLEGAMTAYRVSCARMIIKTVRDRSMPRKAAVIAVTTAIVESGLRNYTEAVDHDSLGLFQQRASWGSASNRTDPTWATNAFLNKMVTKYPNDSWVDAPVGEVAQAVQVSAFPDRYGEEAGDGSKIVNAVWDFALGRRLSSVSGDGRADLMVHQVSGDVSLRTNQGDHFDGGRVMSSGWQNFLGQPGQGKLYFADINGDGRTDLLHHANGDVSVRYNQGGDHFDGGRVFTSGWQDFMGHPGQGKLYFADINGDGKADLLHHANGEVSVRYNKGDHFDGGRVFTQGWQDFMGYPGQGVLYFA